jgi:hypothetical protein
MGRRESLAAIGADDNGKEEYPVSWPACDSYIQLLHRLSVWKVSAAKAISLPNIAGGHYWKTGYSSQG